MISTVPLNQIIKITKGKKEQEKIVLSGAEKRYIQIEDLRNDNNIKYCLPNQRSVSVTSSDILIAWDGANAGTVGFSLEGIIGSTLARLQVDTAKAYPPYLGRYLQSQMSDIRNSCTGATIPHISGYYLKGLVVPLPSLPEQKRIAAILDKADALRNKRRQSIAKLDELLQSVFLDMFGDPVTNPKGPVGSLEEFCKKITDGTHISPRWATQGVPFLFVSNIKNCEINFDTKKFISDEEYNRLTKNNPIEKGDILYTVVGSYGNPAMIRDDRKFAFQRHIAHLKPKKAMSSEYLESMLNTKAILQQADQVVTGIAQKTLILRALRKLKIIIPTYDQQINFTKQKEAIMKQLSLQKAMYYQCEIFFSSLQQRAFQGEL